MLSNNVVTIMQNDISVFDCCFVKNKSIKKSLKKAVKKLRLLLTTALTTN